MQKDKEKFLRCKTQRSCEGNNAPILYILLIAYISTDVQSWIIFKIYLSISQLIYKFWVDNSVPSANVKDVKHLHSKMPGHHQRVKDADGKSYAIVCKTKRCQMHQKRYFFQFQEVLENKS